MLAKDFLVERWFRVTGAMGAPHRSSLTTLEMILRFYSAEGRFYHNLDHLQACFQHFDRAPFEANNFAVELALWFHDLVYDTKGKDNEGQSARMAYNGLGIMGAEKPVLELVHDLILATRHDALPESPSAKLLVDVDLSILGEEPAVFDKYDQDIRKEYAWVPEEQYRAGRRAVLQRFVDREHIYSTTYFRELLEEQARTNLKRIIESLA